MSHTDNNRPLFSDFVTPSPDLKPAQIEIPYGDFGYIPNVAQAAQAAVPPNPHLNPQPYFTTADNAVANWFTTRVHLSPLGRV